MSEGYLKDDDTFDRLYPYEIRQVSRRFWTPLETARRAALLLEEAGVTTLLDVGSGVGKFALVAGATVPSFRVLGVEQRRHLLDVARAARDTMGLTNVTFAHGNATLRSWDGYTGFYFYNSFAENLFDPSDRLDDKAPLSFATFAKDVQRAFALLAAAPVGTAMASYYGSSGRVPTTYELVTQQLHGMGWLRLWVKRKATGDGSYYIEDGEAVVRHDS
jgi:SAM-dependent methyltransferase